MGPALFKPGSVMIELKDLRTVGALAFIASELARSYDLKVDIKAWA